MAFELNEGQGTLFRNDKKPEGSKQPDYRGEAMMNGELHEVAGWIKDGKRGKWMSLQFKPKEDIQKAAQDQGVAPTQDDQIPF